MYKLIALVFALFLSACANYSINGTMCEKKYDPTDPVPPECKVYSEEGAAKASENKQDLLDADDAIEFIPEKE